MKTSGVDHITLIVKDVQKSKEFYTRVCGMKVIVEEKEVVGLTDGTFSLWIALSREGKSPPFNPELKGLNRWAFKVTSMQELQNIEKELKQLDIPMEDNGITDDGYGGTGIFTQDPDGMKVEFHALKKLSVGKYFWDKTNNAQPKVLKT